MSDASPWHWESLREGKRQAEAARAAAAAAEAEQWALMAWARQAVAAAAGGSAEPDEMDQEMLAQMAGGHCASSWRRACCPCLGCSGITLPLP